jgi:hypothetical protein
MKKLIGVLAVLAFLVSARASVRANEAAPPPDKPSLPAAVPVVIVVDDSAQQPRLEIPRKVLSSLKASADGEEGDTRRAAILPQLHTIIAGVALSLALTLGGLWLVRSRRRFTGTGAALLVVTLAVAAGGGALWANLPPPPPMPDPGIRLADKATVQIVDKGDAIRLIVSSKQLTGVLDKVRGDREKQPQPTEKPAEKKENEAK